jgi:hypothetical protein
MEITDNRNKTTVRAVSTTADVSTNGRGGKPGPPGWKYTKKSNLRSEEMASKSAKAAIRD